MGSQQVEISWIILTLAATLIWSVSAIINKYARVSYFENSLGYIIFIAPTTIFALVLLFFEPFVLLDAKLAIFAVLTGVLAILGYYFYLEALHKEELSRVLILYGTGPLFILVLSTIFLKEMLTIQQYIAFALIFAGSILVSFKKEKIRLRLGVLLVLLSAVFFSVQGVILKYISEVNLTTVMIYRQIGILIPVLFVLLASSNARMHAKKVINDLDAKKTALVYSAEIIGMAGMFLVYLALQKGPVSLVGVLESFEIIFIFILTIIISAFFPKILKEEIDRKTIIIKIISILLMLAGVYLISV